MTKAEILEAKLREEFKKKGTTYIVILYSYNATGKNYLYSADVMLWHGDIEIYPMLKDEDYSAKEFIDKYPGLEVYFATPGEKII